ncbi:MAG: hypothetical protein ACK5LC_14555 [Coprobacillaceae bacterium]
MNCCGYNYSGCGCNSYAPKYAYNPFGCGGCGTGYSGGYGNGIGWIAIVLVIFLILIIANIC